jgi:acetyl esterase/lipase
MSPFSSQKNIYTSDPSVATTILDVCYGIDPAQTMDIYLPANRSSSFTKFLAIIHGGGFNSGSKAELNMYIHSIQQLLPDYAFFNIDYRMATSRETVFPTQENDVNAAVKFIVSNSDAWHVSEKLVLLGISAGGTLALLQGYKYSSSTRAKAIVSFFGPTDLRELYNQTPNPLVSLTLELVTGKKPDEDELIYANSSPINFVDFNSPPTMLLQGGLDPIVTPDQPFALIAKLNAAGVINQYVFYPTEGHGWVGANLFDSFDKLQAFLVANVN